MARTTSIEVYHKIERDGLLSALRFQIYQVLFKDGPLTASEIAQRINRPRDSVSPRLMELKDRNAVKEVEVRACGVTRENVLTFDVTDQIPTPGPRNGLRREFWIVGTQAFMDESAANQAAGSMLEIIPVRELKSVKAGRVTSQPPTPAPEPPKPSVMDELMKLLKKKKENGSNGLPNPV